MVYIKSLICEGFKSFKSKTKINFSKGFTSIVGANGSGKSNILDAFVFALGELSGNKLRVNNIKDLICNGGTNNGTPSKWARVDVIFDNTEKKIPINADEVKVSRKIDVEGNGKYYINDKATTRRELQDIMDLAGLIPNSSNLILQGELFRIINMNNNERRGLIEEISGIASYNEKKEQAEKDLAVVEENISRVTLLMNEVSDQLDSLEKEKNDALKYQEYDIKQKNAEKTQIFLKIRDFENEISITKEKRDLLKQDIDGIEKNVVEKRADLSKLAEELDLVTNEIKKLQTSELKELTSKLNDFKTELAKKEAQKSNYEIELKRLKKELIESFKKKSDFEKKKETISEMLKSKNSQKKSLKEQLESLKEELYHAEGQIKEFDSEYSELQQKLDVVKKELFEENNFHSEINSEVKVLQNKAEHQNKTINAIKKKINNINTEIEKFQTEIKQLEVREKEISTGSDITINFEELEQQKRKINLELEKLRDIIEEKHTDLISIQSKIKVVESFSTNKAVEAILKLKRVPKEQGKNGVHGTVYGTVSQLGKANDKYNTALQIAGGNKLNYLVVENQETAKECINYLKKDRIGSASFIPLAEIRSESFNLNFKTNDKVIGMAVDLIQFDPMFTSAFNFIFGKTIVVDNLNTASTLQINVKKVTLDGDVIEASNLMTGGMNKRFNQGSFGSVEESKLPALEGELSELKRKESALVNKLRELEVEITANYKSKISTNNEINKIKQNLAVFQDKLVRKEEELKELRKELEISESEIINTEKRLQDERTKLKEADDIVVKLKENEKGLREKISSLKNNDFTRKVNELRANIDKFEKERMNLDLEITKLETKLDEITSNREVEILDAIKMCQDQITAGASNIDVLIKESEEVLRVVSDLEAKVLEKNQVLGQTYTKKEDLLQKQTRIKSEIEELKSQIHPKNIKINILETNLKNIEAQKEEIEKTVKIEDSALKEIQELLLVTHEKLSDIINESVGIKRQLEPVNMKAIKKYDKIKNRYDDLIQKHEIVVNERKSILEFIEKVELEKKKTFLNAFQGINENFKDIFAKLSPGGEAKLELENEEDPFAGGIRMLARPGGKKWCLIQSMSGGEKSLTVIALVLGIQMYIPSPYYILDEIDAALDDFNANQVALMIKELSSNSQFILITHRDVTMAKTDQLLGVSNIHGITSVLNLNIKEALDLVAESQ